MSDHSTDDYGPDEAEEGAKRNRASWRRDCEEICRSGRCSEEVRELAQKMLRLLDETEGMYRGEMPNQKALVELMDTLDELRSKIRIYSLTVEKSLVLDDRLPRVR